MGKLKTDLSAALLIGLLASFFSFLAVKNLSEIISLKIPLLAQNPFLIPFLLFVPLCLGGILVARFFASRIPIIYQFGKFAEVGGLNFLVDNGSVNFFMLIFGVTGGIFYSVYKGISVLLAMTNSYFWNKFWVFGGKKKDIKKEAGQFYLVSFIGFLINVGIASFFVNFFPTAWDPKIIGNAGSILGSIMALFWNFFGYKYWVFK